jgi:hypothetical protein
MAHNYSPSGVEYAEQDGSPQESWTDKGLRSSVKLLTPWDLRYFLVDDILGSSLLYPPAPFSQARATEATIVPFGDGIPSANKKYHTYPQADVTITFAYDSNGPQTTDLISESLEPTAEFLTIDNKDIRWDSQSGDPVGPGDSPGLMLRGFTWVYTQHKVFNVPSIILSLGSCVNASAVVAPLLGLTFPPQTLLYQPPTLQRKITSQEIEAWSITHRFAYRPQTWNKFFNPKTGSFSFVYHKDSSSPLIPYTPASFDPIFYVH